MNDNRIELIMTYQKMNKRPINQALIKQIKKLQPDWVAEQDMLAVQQATLEALETIQIQDQDEIEAMLLYPLYSKRAITKFQEKIMEAKTEAGDQIITVEEIQATKDLGELNLYLAERVRWILKNL